MTKINCTNSRYGVEFIENEDSILTVAVINDGETYGGSSYWFTVGTYKTMKNAVRFAAKKLQMHGLELATA